jgi:hypothetical protein
MWESRVLGEISKRLWKSFCDFHRRVISIAASLFVSHRPSSAAAGGVQTLGAFAIVVPTASYAVVFALDRLRMQLGLHEAAARRLRMR